MNLLPLQVVLLVASGLGLFFLWRAATPSERWLQWIVAAGFLVRAIGSQVLFWISWLRLPILRSLQTPDGYWLFAQDSSFYFPQAIAAAEKGLRAIALYDRGSASVTYVQLLATTIWLLGRPASVGILLNLFCYLGTVALLLRWSRVEPATRTAVAVAITAISLTPALVLWSLQPLKDSLFQLLFVAFVAACATWQRAWLATNASWRTRIVTGVSLAIVLFLLAGIRWYFAGALVAATSLFLLIVAFSAAERKTISFAAAVMMIVVLTQSLVLSAEQYMPPELVALLTMKSTRTSLAQVPQSMVADVERARRGFDTTPASTRIRSGRRLTSADATPPPAVVPPPPPMPAQLAAADAAKIRALLDRQNAAWNRSDVAGAMDGYWRSPQLEIVDGTKVVRGWEQAVEDQRRGRGVVSKLRMSILQVAGAGDTATVNGRWEVTTVAGDRETQMFTMTLRRFPDGEWKIVREVFPTSPPPAPAAVRTAAPPPAPPRVQRLLVGAAALTVPRVLGERLGLFDIGGGRGLLWFTEIDTVIFDLALLFALRMLFARGAAPWRNPLTWLVLLTTAIVGAPLVYSISNFGTLFRLREMIYLGTLLIAIAATADRGRP